MSATTCQNCGKGEAVTSCVGVTGYEHTHPRSHLDLTPVPCSNRICSTCSKSIRANLRKRAG